MRFSPSQIILLESDVNYTRLHFSDGSVVLTSTNLGKLEPRFLAHSFFRINRRFMVNLQYIVAQYDSTMLVLANQMEVCLSRRKKDLFFKNFTLTNKEI